MNSDTFDKEIVRQGLFFGHLGFSIRKLSARLRSRAAKVGGSVFKASFRIATIWLTQPVKWLVQRQGPADGTPASNGEHR